MATPTLSVILFAPISEFLPEGFQQGMYTTPFDAFATRFKLSFWASVVACSPVILWQILAFFLPALKPKERKWFIPTFAIAVFLFIFGTLFCYFIILQAAFGWLLGETGDFAQVIASAEDFLNMIMLLEIGFGAAFELPLVIFYLVIFHLVPYSVLRRQWRYVYVILLCFSAIVTPDASPVTMALMFCALVGLYEVSLFVARQVITVREGRQALKYTREDYREGVDED